MFECLFLGDSIGLGTAQAVNRHYSKQCDVLAAERASSATILRWRLPSKRYGTSVFSLGSNDAPGRALIYRLTRVRASIVSGRVIWILPYARRQAYDVASVAIAFRDETIDLARFESRDRVHPQRYDDFAKALLR